jgi:hypothetical protein
MLFFRHRVNSAADVAPLPRAWGVEIDLRSDVAREGELHLSHDPWRRGDAFPEWLRAYAAGGPRGPVILNTKEDALEERALAVALAAGVEPLFLDTTLPTLVKWVRRGEGHRFFVRVSAWEPVEAVAAFRGKVRWVWVDCFGGEPLGAAEVARLKPDFRVCLVSPELQGSPPEAIERFDELWPLADAVCTKVPERWSERFGS